MVKITTPPGGDYEALGVASGTSFRELEEQTRVEHCKEEQCEQKTAMQEELREREHKVEAEQAERARRESKLRQKAGDRLRI